MKIRHKAILFVVLGTAGIPAYGLFGQAALTDPYLILRKSIDAVGGMERIKAEKSRYIEGNMEIKGANLKGTLKQWEAGPLLYRQEIDLKIFKQVEGDNGQVRWTMNANQKVQIRRDEVTLKRRRLKELQENFENLNPESPYFKVTLEGIQKVGTADCYVVKTRNTINQDVRLDFINTVTFLAEKSVDKQPDRETHILFSDIRTVGGLRRPFRQDQEILPLGQKINIQFTAYESNPAINPALFEPPSADVRDFRFLKGDKAEDIPFKFVADHLFIPVKIKGREKLWILDTGAQMSAIGSFFASELGLKPEGKIKGSGAGRTVDVSFVALPPYEVAGIEFDSQKAVCLDVDPALMNMLGMEVVGILGYDFFSRFITKVDYARQRISFYLPGKFTYQGNGKIVEAPLAGNTFTVPVIVDGTYSGTWSVDLGAGNCNFHFPYAEEHGLLALPGVECAGLGAGGEFREKEIKFKTMEFAGFTINEPLIDVTLEKGEGAFSRSEIVGNLGNTLFRNFVLYLDYKSQRMIIEKGVDFGRRYPTDKSGLSLVLSPNQEYVVFFVSPGTPAEQAGFRKNDVVLKINGKDPKSYGGLLDVRDLMKKEAGTVYQISIRRADEVRDLQLKLKELH